MSRELSVDCILAEALEVPVESRDAFLDQACQSDAALRSRVQELIGALERNSSFLADPTVAAPASRTGRVAPATEAVGQRIGPYKLLERIGEGGFGLVYLAEQEQPIRRRWR